MVSADYVASGLQSRGYWVGRAGQWRATTTAVCHGGDTNAGLHFTDAADGLQVVCHTRHCKEGLTARLLAAAGIGRDAAPVRFAAANKPRKEEYVNLPAREVAEWSVDDLLAANVWYIHGADTKGKAGFTLSGIGMRHSCDGRNARLARQGGRYGEITLLPQQPYGVIQQVIRRGYIARPRRVELPAKCRPALSMVANGEELYPAPLVIFDFDYRPDKDPAGEGRALRDKHRVWAEQNGYPCAVSRSGNGFHQLALAGSMTDWPATLQRCGTALAPGLTLDVFLAGSGRYVGLRADALPPGRRIPVMPAERIRLAMGLPAAPPVDISAFQEVMDIAPVAPCGVCGEPVYPGDESTYYCGDCRPEV